MRANHLIIFHQPGYCFAQKAKIKWSFIMHGQFHSASNPRFFIGWPECHNIFCSVAQWSRLPSQWLGLLSWPNKNNHARPLNKQNECPQWQSGLHFLCKSSEADRKQNWHGEIPFACLFRSHWDNIDLCVVWCMSTVLTFDKLLYVQHEGKASHGNPCVMQHHTLRGPPAMRTSIDSLSNPRTSPITVLTCTVEPTSPWAATDEALVLKSIETHD